MGTKLEGQAITDEKGNYVVAESQFPVVTPRPNVILPKERAALRSVRRLRNRFGLGSGLRAEANRCTPQPKITRTTFRSRLPLGKPVEVYLKFPNAASMAGRVTNENGQPVAHCKVTDRLRGPARQRGSGNGKYVYGRVALPARFDWNDSD